MSLELASYIDGLVDTNPITADDAFQTAADHIRLIKRVLLATFPALTGAVTATQADLNALAGITNLGEFPTGTHMLFVDNLPPAGWTLDTSVNDMLVRIDNSNGATTGGSWDSSVFTGTTNTHALVVAEIPAHSHKYTDIIPGAGGTNAWYTAGGTTGFVVGLASSGSTGNSPASPHSHDFSITTDPAWRPAYIDAVIGIRS